MLNERDLRYFVNVAEVGNVHRVAERLHITQPALSKCIKRLEEQFETTLFERRGRSIVLTEVGRQLFERAKLILRGIDDAYRETLDYAQGQKGHIRIGAAATVAEFLMPSVLRMTNQRMPDVTLEITVGMSDVLRDALRRDELDLVIGPTSDSDNFDCRSITDDRVVVVASRDHPLVGRDVKLDELCQYAWVLAARPVVTRRWIDDVFVSHELPPPRVKVEVNTLVQLPQLIYQSDLLSFVSRRNLEKPEVADRIAEVRAPQASLSRYFGVLTRRGGYLTKASQILIETLLERQDQM